MDQLSLFSSHDGQSIKDYLEKSCELAVSVVITNNTSTMISYRPTNDAVLVRLHRMFLSAGTEVLDEIVAFISNRKKKTPLLREFINSNSHQIQHRPWKKGDLRTKGRYHDLGEMFGRINEEYFHGAITAAITWGSKGPRRCARLRTLGSFSSDNNMIRINPILDRKGVPTYFLEFIVYHEMLHADMGIETHEGLRSIHSKEFRNREKMFEHYERAMAWEKKKWS